MNIKINERTRITSDKMNVIVETRTERNPDEKNPDTLTAWQHPKYFPNIESACQYVLNLRMMESELSGCENFVFFPALPEDRLVELYERSFGQIWFVQAGEKRPPNGGS